MLRLLAACASLAAAEPLPPAPPRAFSNETPYALVIGENLPEVSFVAEHCVALHRHLEFALNLPPPPPPLAHIEVVAAPRPVPVETQFSAGVLRVTVRLGDGREAPGRAAEAAARAWLARVALSGGKPADAAEGWTRQALASEIVAQLRPAMNDYWYREGRQAIPSPLADIVAGKAPEREAFLFWRALRSSLGPAGEQAKALVASARGEPVLKLLASLAKSPDEWWLVQRAELLLSRSPVSLGLHESAESLDDIARFVFDLGHGDELVSGPELVRHRDLPAVKASMQARLTGLRREILRQNPVYHNAWRTFGAWLEKFPDAKPEELAVLWAEYQEERKQAEQLRREVEAALNLVVPAAK